MNLITLPHPALCLCSTILRWGLGLTWVGCPPWSGMGGGLTNTRNAHKWKIPKQIGTNAYTHHGFTYAASLVGQARMRSAEVYIFCFVVI